MKVIFLDIDGVLNHTKTVRGWGKMRFVDTRKMLRVKEICDRTGAKVVISSSWRWGTQEDALPEDKRQWSCFIEECDKHHIPVIDITPFSVDNHRGSEIMKWLMLHDSVTDYVVIDDIPYDMHMVKEHFVLTKDHIGLNNERKEKAIEILEGKLSDEYKQIPYLG